MSIVVIRLLDGRGIYYPTTLCVGRAELRPEKSDTPREREALTKSSAAFEYAWKNNCMRIVTVIDAANELEADIQAEEVFEECLDVLESMYAASKMALLPIGAYRVISNDRVTHRVPASTALPTTAAKIAYENFPQCEWSQYLISLNSDLGKRLLRSYHWSRKAKWEANSQLRILFRWFAMEAIWMINADENIIPRVRWALGFPNGAGAQRLSPDFQKALRGHPSYDSSRRIVQDRLEEVRVFRNSTVHNGFRHQDISRDDLFKLDRITALACGRVQKCAQGGILHGLTMAKELLDDLPKLTEMTRPTSMTCTGIYFFSYNIPLDVFNLLALANRCHFFKGWGVAHLPGQLAQ
jgi:hypothetical protein